MESQATSTECPSCHSQNNNGANFCQSCGKKLKEPPISITLSKQLIIYLIAILAPPFGLIPAIKYLKSPDSKTKTVGIITIILTVISLVFAYLVIKGFLSAYTNAIQMTTGGGLGI